MPLYKIGAGPMPTSNNVAALNQQYHSDCLQAPIEALELALGEGLGLPPNMAVEFNLEGLLRMDQPTQFEMLTKAVGGSLMTPNEARGKANLPKAAGGDAIYQQQQYYSLAALAKRDASDDPFGKKAAAPAPAPEPASDPAPAAPAPKAAAVDDPTVADLIGRAVKSAMDAQRAELDAAIARTASAPAPDDPDDDVDQEEFLEALLELIDGTPAT
jgi:phage portal protein BeeE